MIIINHFYYLYVYGFMGTPAVWRFIGHTFGVRVQKVQKVQRVQRVQRRWYRPVGRCLCFAKAYPHRSADLLPKEGGCITCLPSLRHSHSERKRRIFVHADSVSSTDKYKSAGIGRLSRSPLFRGQNRPLCAFLRRTADSR